MSFLSTDTQQADVIKDIVADQFCEGCRRDINIQNNVLNSRMDGIIDKDTQLLSTYELFNEMLRVEV